MRDYAYYNGTFTPYDAAAISLHDRAVFFAEAVYDVIIGRNGIPYQMDIHLSRLFKNATAIGLQELPTLEDIYTVVEALIQKSKLNNFILYIQLSGKEKRRSHSRTENGVNLLITITAAEIPVSLGLTDAVILPDMRHDYCNIKTTNLLPAILSVCDAEMLDCDTAIFHRNSIVSEASSANVSILKSGMLITHPLDMSILGGISELNLIEAAKTLGLSHERALFKINDLFDADAVLLTSTTKLVKLCRSIDGKKIKCTEENVVKSIFDLMLDDLIAKTTL